ncbi:hypothetical protein FRC03_003861, partial [Tulasnella sp. 419]
FAKHFGSGAIASLIPDSHNRLQLIGQICNRSQRPSSIFLPLASECLTGAWGDY